MKKVLWVSEYNFNTGFARVSESLVSHLSSRYDMTVLDVHRSHAQIPYGDIMYLGTKSAEDRLGIGRLADICDQFDTIVIIQDAFDIANYLKAIKASGRRIPKIVVYFPVDLSGHKKEWYVDFDIVKQVITYTKFGADEVTPLLPKTFKGKLHTIPHGVDTDIFHSLPGEMSALRTEFMRGDTRFNDCFILLNANRNQPRKRLDITFEAFSIFAKHKPDVRLWMHCGIVDASMNLYVLAKRYGIEEKLALSGPQSGILRFSNKQLNLLYNICDVGLNSSLGEGFGLTSSEHAAVGKPQIVPAHSALNELFAGITPIAAAPTPFMLDNLTTGYLVDPVSMADCMEKLYSDKKYYRQCAQACKEKFTSGKYQWRNIFQEWMEYI